MPKAGYPATAPSQGEGRQLAATPGGLRVFMMDLWCVVPYYTGYLCESLRGQGVDLTLGSITYHYDRAHFSRHGLRTDPGILDVVSRFEIRTALLRRGLKFAENCANLLALAVRFLARRPDVIHVQFLQLVEQGLPFELWLIGWAKRLGIRLVYTVHNELPLDGGGRQRRTYESIYSRMDALICHNEATRDRLIRVYGVPAERIHVIPHGPLFAEAEVMERPAARQKIGLRPEDVVVLWQGWIKPYKGVLFLLDAWAKVQEQEPNARLVIAGSGDEQSLAEIREKVAALRMEHSVRLELRFLDIAEFPAYFSSADVLAYPYREITTSGALMTGLHYGKAIVATNLPAFQEELENGVSALLVDYGDASALAEALLMLISDAGLRTRLAANAAKLASSPLSWKGIAEQTRRCYEQVLRPNRGALRTAGGNS